MPTPININQKPPVEDPKDKKKPPQKPEQSNWLGRTVFVVIVVAVSVATIYGLYELALYVKDVIADKFSKETDQQLEDKAHSRGLSRIVDKVKQIESINKRRVLKRLAECKEHEVKILNRLEDSFVFTVDHLKEMLMGAHIRLNDQGTTYKEWAKMAHVKPRISSHPSDGQQYSIQGSLIKELLFSFITDTGRIYSWFQLEANPVSVGSVGRHMLDYVAYKVSSANQGPYGSSPITDLKPLLIDPRMP